MHPTMTTSKKLWLGFSVLAILLIFASLAIRADAADTMDTASQEWEWIAALLVIVGCGVAVVTTVVISRAIVKSERHAEDARSFADNIVETVREPLLVLDGELRVVRVNRAFYQTFKVTPAETGNSLLYKVGNGQWDILELRTLLEEILPQHTEVHDFEVVHIFEHIGKKTIPPILWPSRTSPSASKLEAQLLLNARATGPGQPPSRQITTTLISPPNK